MDVLESIRNYSQKWRSLWSSNAPFHDSVFEYLDFEFVNWLTFQQTAKNFIIQPGASPVRWYWYKIKYANRCVYQIVAEWNMTNKYFLKIEPLQ